MGKWTEVVKGMPRVGPEGDEELKFQQKVDAQKTLVAAKTPVELAAVYAQLRDEQEKVADMAADVHLRLTAVEQLMWEAYENAGLESLKLTNGGSVAVRSEPKTIIRDPRALQAWYMEQKRTPPMQFTWNTVNAEVKQRIEEGLGYPPGVDVKSKTTSVYTKPKVKTVAAPKAQVIDLMAVLKDSLAKRPA